MCAVGGRAAVAVAVGIGKLCKTVRVILQTVNRESTCSCYAAGKAFLPTIPTDLQRVFRHCNEVWL